MLTQTQSIQSLQNVLSHSLALQSEQGGEPALAKKTFTHHINTYLKDSNAYTNIYFSRYFEWQGMCREHWFQRHITEDMLQGQGVLITKSAHNDYVQETFPFQTVVCTLNTFMVKNCSFFLIFRFYCEGRLVSTGYQQIVFADQNRRISRFPEAILQKVREYEITPDMM